MIWWNVVAWIAAVSMAIVAITSFVMLKRANGLMPLKMRMMNFIMATLLAGLAVRELWAASMEDSFQRTLQAIIDGQPIILNRGDRFAFSAWLNTRRVTHVLAFIAAFCIVPFADWWIDHVRRWKKSSGPDGP